MRNPVVGDPLPTVSLRRIEVPRRAAGVVVTVPLVTHAEMTAAVGVVACLLGPSVGTSVASGSTRPTLLIEGGGLVLVQNHIRRPPARGLFALRVRQLERRRRSRYSTSVTSPASRNVVVVDPASVDVQSPGAVLLDIGGNRPPQRLPGHHHWLKCGLQRRAPALPLLGRLGRGGGFIVFPPGRIRTSAWAALLPLTLFHRPGPMTSRSAPAALSMALLTSSDFGNPDPYSHAIESRISNPASSTATAIRCHVRVPPKANRWPPVQTRGHSSAHSPFFFFFWGGGGGGGG